MITMVRAMINPVMFLESTVRHVQMTDIDGMLTVKTVEYETIVLVCGLN